jgi:L-arabonate dehydrase
MQKTYRSQDWFGRKDKDGIIYRSWMKNQGMPNDMFDGRPVIGICNTYSELTPCNAHFRSHAEAVKRGVLEAGGFPVEFPIMSLGETLLKPTAMLFRNLASMDTEESIRGNPIDGVVLLTGCDKTTPSTVMGASSVGLPTIVVPGGPMLNGRYKGQMIGSGTHVWKFDEEMKMGRMTQEDCEFAESCMSRSIGHCMTMGTASTMACMVEALGLTLPGAAAIPAADSRKKVMAQLSGRRIVEMVKENLTIDKILTREAFENSIKVNAAVGGSSNFIIHLLAIAGRIGVELKLEDFDTVGSNIPLLLNLMPSGKYLMEDFYYAGGLPAILHELKQHLHENVITVTGKNLHDNIAADCNCYDRNVISSYEKPLINEAGCVVVKGNLAENGAVRKPSAATPALLKHKGRAVVFESIEDYHARVDDMDLDIDENSVMVLKYVGPVGYPGMPEVGNMALPKKILQKGITDMVRISDGRMSGTAYGTVVLHVSPESAIGGNLALVHNGDEIELDVPARTLTLHVSNEELAIRRSAWIAPGNVAKRGYASLYVKHVMGADKGADLDFLVGSSGSEVTRDSH